MWNISCYFHACSLPVQDFSSQIVPNTIEVLLVQQDLTNRAIKSPIAQMRQDILPAKTIAKINLKAEFGISW